MAPPPRILVANDDGHHSDGVVALAEAMAPLGEVWVVAPESEQSAASRSISLHRPLRIRELQPRWFAVDGTPTDCVYLAIHHLMKGQRPLLMVSGINHGPNIADDVTYSGTVAAAMEASLLGVHAIAFSLACGPPHDFRGAARFARALAGAVLTARPSVTLLLNVNVPGGVDSENYALTRLGKHSYGSDVAEAKDPRGRTYFWIGGGAYQHEDIPGSDCNVVFDEQRISVTPLRLQLTDEERLPELRHLSVPGFSLLRRPGDSEGYSD